MKTSYAVLSIAIAFAVAVLPSGVQVQADQQALARQILEGDSRAAMHAAALAEICPPEGGERALFHLTGLAPGKANAARAAEAGLPDFAPENARVLRDESDAQVCIGLMKWAKSLVGRAGPQRHWAFYATGDRYIVISWRETAQRREGMVPLPGGDYIGIFNPDLELLWMSPR
jgi:hypothetical protein